jgi:hypothetical protein
MGDKAIVEVETFLWLFRNRFSPRGWWISSRRKLSKYTVQESSGKIHFCIVKQEAGGISAFIDAEHCST